MRPLMLALAAASLAGCAGGSGAGGGNGIDDLLGGDRINVDGKYRGGNLIRAQGIARGQVSPALVLQAVITKAAEMTVARGHDRFAVVKVSDCGTLMMNGSIPLSSSCRVLAQMLGPGEVAQAEGDNPITYYRTGDVLVGNISPEAP